MWVINACDHNTYITNLTWLGYMQWYIIQKFNFFFLTCCKPQHFVSTSTCKPSEDSKVSFILISINWSNLSFRVHFQLVSTSVSIHFITAVCGSEIIFKPCKSLHLLIRKKEENLLWYQVWSENKLPDWMGVGNLLAIVQLQIYLNLITFNLYMYI